VLRACVFVYMLLGGWGEEFLFPFFLYFSPPFFLTEKCWQQEVV
jgi:hypothetical protein